MRTVAPLLYQFAGLHAFFSLTKKTTNLTACKTMKVTSKILDTELKKGFLRVAFATSDNETVNEHFGWANSFLIYDVSRVGFVKVGKIQFDTDSRDTECNPENKHFEKINALQSCHIVYSQSIGGPAAARLTQKKIHPLVVKNSPPITNTLTELKAVLNGPVPPWVRKLVEKEDPQRFDSI